MRILPATFLVAAAITAHADWPMLHGNARHDGFVSAEINAPFQLAWARHFAGERLGTAMEPIVANGKVFVATHSGNVHALDAESGDWRWGFEAHGPFLHSPTFSDGLVIAGSADGNLYALDATSGKLKWSCHAAHGGFAASPVVSDGRVFIGARAGDFLAVNLKSGKPLWRQPLSVPIRQTAAIADGSVNPIQAAKAPA